jgi:hypothetical protein
MSATCFSKYQNTASNHKADSKLSCRESKCQPSADHSINFRPEIEFSYQKLGIFCLVLCIFELSILEFVTHRCRICRIMGALIPFEQLDAADIWEMNRALLVYILYTVDTAWKTSCCCSFINLANAFGWKWQKRPRPVVVGLIMPFF